MNLLLVFLTGRLSVSTISGHYWCSSKQEFQELHQVVRGSFSGEDNFL